tara:strand:- start:655 stop:1500 length:846 start_codon:yes stop_codon:yes gene_type:complete
MNTEEKMKKILILKKAILKNIVDTAYYAGASSAHIGGALSAVDIVSTLFSEFIKINPENIKKIDRDYFILSKGHACLVYYAALVEMGFFSRNELKSFEKTDSFLLGHPVLDKKHGIDFSTGSLGMGLSIGVGLALSLKKRKVNNKIYVLIGDGECNEGSIWESVMSASHFNLDNLNIIIDKNNLQQTGKNSEIMNLGDLKAKLSSFGCETYSVNGHSIKELFEIFSIQNKTNKTKAVVANTTKGKGLSFAENNNKFHHTVLTKSLYDKALEEIKNYSSDSR